MSLPPYHTICSVVVTPSKFVISLINAPRRPNLIQTFLPSVHHQDALSVTNPTRHNCSVEAESLPLSVCLYLVYPASRFKLCRSPVQSSAKLKKQCRLKDAPCDPTSPRHPPQPTERSPDQILKARAPRKIGPRTLDQRPPGRSLSQIKRVSLPPKT